MVYIKQFVDDHKEQLGDIKALGYSNGQLASDFGPLDLVLELEHFSLAASFLMGHFIMTFEMKDSAEIRG